MHISMNRFIAIFKLFPLTVLTTSAQDYFITEFPFREINDKVLMEVSEDNGVIIAGTYSRNSDLNGLFIRKYNTCGKFIWGKKIDLPDQTLDLVDMRQDSLGNFLVTGNLGEIHNGRPYLLSFQESGTINFFNKYETGNGIDNINYALGVSPDNQYYLYFNYNTDPSATNNKISLMKIRADGSVNWFKSYDSGEGAFWGRIIASRDSGVLARSGNVIFKLDRLGNVEWANLYNGLGINMAEFPIETNNGYVFFREYISAAGHGRSAFMLNPDGSLAWNTGDFNFYPERGILRKNGNILYSGSVASKGIDFAFLELNPQDGSIEQFINYGVTAFPRFRWANDLAEDSKQNIFVVATHGSSVQLPNSQRLILAKFNDTLAIKDCPYIPAGNTFGDTAITRQSLNMTIVPNENITVIELQPTISNENLNIQGSNSCSFNANTKVVNIGNDTTICPGTSLELNAGSFSDYLWSTGENAQTISVSDSGLYWVEVTTPCITLRDTIKVNLHRTLNVQYEIFPKEAKTGEKISFINRTNKSNRVKWDLGDGTTQQVDSFLHKYELSGNYNLVLEVTSPEGCIFSEEISINVLRSDVHIPNVFTPNGDGKNDIFQPSGKDIMSFEVIIFNRWGEKVYQNQDIGWDGKNQNGVNLNHGTYQYILKITFKDKTTNHISGQVTLLK